MGKHATKHSGIFPTSGVLPRGRHSLSAEEVAASQRRRIMAAVVALIAEKGFAGATIGEIATRASVSRSAFYQHFAHKQDCLFAAYDTFFEYVLARMAGAVDAELDWEDRVEALVGAFLQALEDDPVAVRTFFVEMSAARENAYAKERDGQLRFAKYLHQRHVQARQVDPGLGPLPLSVFLGFVFAVRALVSDAIRRPDPPRLTDLTLEIKYWVVATIAGAASAADRLGGPPSRMP